MDALTTATSTTGTAGKMSPKALTKEIVGHFAKRTTPEEDEKFSKMLISKEMSSQIDGMNVLTLLFQCARFKKNVNTFIESKLILEKLQSWERQWNEIDVSTFMYGIQSLECISDVDGLLLKFAATKIKQSNAELSSRAIGNALYGLNKITSDTVGVPELAAAMAEKIQRSPSNLNGQDIGIGLYGMQGLSASIAEIGLLIEAVAAKIEVSEAELDGQALSNALYGLQSMSSDHKPVLHLVSALASKVSDSQPELCAQAIGSALFGLQKLSSDALEVRTLIAALTEKVETATVGLDAQAIGNALFGLQRMKSNSAEVRSLVQVIANKMVLLEVQMDAKGIGEALYGLHSMSSDVPQVRALLAALADRIALSSCELTGQGIADALYGMYSMTADCPELRALLAAVSDKINAQEGKLDAQEIGNALYGLQGVTSDMYEVRVIVSKLALKIRRSKALLRAQHIGRALLGLQRFSAESAEVRMLIKELSKRIAESDRTKLTGTAIADALYGLQGFTSNIPEVQELVGELAKKIAQTAATLNSEQVGRALYGLQGLSSAASIFQESAIGLDVDEVSFLLSTLWDKVKVRKEGMALRDIGLGLQGIVSLRDPIAGNLRQYLYLQLLKLGIEREERSLADILQAETNSQQRQSNSADDLNAVTQMDYSKVPVVASGPVELAAEDILAVYRALKFNDLLIPRWIQSEYQRLISTHSTDKPLVPLSRADKLVSQRFVTVHRDEDVIINAFCDGFRMDLWFPSLRLNVELDGPAHRYPARMRYDQLRDQLLTQKAEVTVRRVALFGRSIDDVVREIYQLVETAKDAQNERDVQRLYAADQDIQRLYAPGSSSMKQRQQQQQSDNDIDKVMPRIASSSNGNNNGNDMGFSISSSQMESSSDISTLMSQMSLLGNTNSNRVGKQTTMTTARRVWAPATGTTNGLKSSSGEGSADKNNTKTKPNKK